jgi:hypothetical protein
MPLPHIHEVIEYVSVMSVMGAMPPPLILKVIEYTGS